MADVSLHTSQLLDTDGIHASGDQVIESLAFESLNIARKFSSTPKTVAGSLPPDEFETAISILLDMGKQMSFIKQQKIGDDLLVKGYEHGLESR